MKENVSLNLDGVTREQPFRTYYQQRNGTIARNIADYLEVPYIGEQSGEKSYIVPPRTIDKATATQLHITNEQDFYGTSVEDLAHVGKSILHPSVSDSAPSFYSNEFASGVRDLVLPGIVAFSKNDLLIAYERSHTQRGLRLKLPDKSDGHGQFAIDGLADLRESLKNISDEEIFEKGIVLEEDVKDAKTISVGFACIGKDVFSFIAHQKDDVDEGRNRYLGAKVLIFKGTMEDLAGNITSSEDEDDAVQKSIAFYNAYSYFNPVSSRLSFDCIHGRDEKGNKISGISDITGRLGGTCPAIMQAALGFKDDPKLSIAFAEVTLNYQPQIMLPEEKDTVIYVDHPTLRISAKVYETR